MKAITLTAPYGTLIAIAAQHPDLGKHIETRVWSTRYRGPLAIHQAKGLGPVGGMRGLHRLISSEPFWSVLREAFAVQLGGERHYPADAETIVDQLPLGAIVAVCNLLDCVPTQHPGIANDPGKPWFTGARKGVGQHYYADSPRKAGRPKKGHDNGPEIRD